MKRSLLHSTLLGLGLQAYAYSQAPAAAPAQPAISYPAPVIKPTNDTKLKDGDRFIFIGDSITHQCQYTQYVEDFYYTRYPHLRLHFRNAGISGNRAQNVLNRWEGDVAAFKPTIATIMLGMNDGSYQDFDKETFETYQKGMLEIMDRLDALKCRVILIGPTMFDHLAFEKMIAADPAKSKGKTPTNYNALMGFYGKWLQEVARVRGYAYVDMYGPLNQITVAQRRSNPEFTLIPDAIHPEADGQLVMAHALLRDLGELRPIGVTGARLEGKTWKPVKGQNGATTTEIQSKGPRELSYVANTPALPWAVFDKAPLGAKLLNLAQWGTGDFQVADGLPPGRYDLFIHGTKVETLGHRALAQRVNLAKDPEAPNYILAKKITELNRKRNEEAIKPLRGVWARHQGWLARKDQDPAKYEVWLKQFKEETSKYEALAEKYEAEIYELNQVKPQKVEIKPAAPAKAA